MSKSCSAIFVFTQSTSVEMLIKHLGSLDSWVEAVLISTHKLFSREIEKIKKAFKGEIHFHCFADFLNAEEMNWCDEEADRLVVARHGERYRRLPEYMQEITRLKNEKVLQNVTRQYESHHNFLLNDDLGIHAKTWIDAGFEQCAPRDHSSGVVDVQVTHRRSFCSILHEGLRWRLAGICQVLEKSLKNAEMCLIERLDERYIFLGRTDKIKQYLHEDVVLTAWPLIKRLSLQLFYKNSIRFSPDNSDNWLCKIILRFGKRIAGFMLPDKKDLKFVAPIHEASEDYGRLALNLGVDLFYMQDGHLPIAFPGQYYCYYYNVAGFLVWSEGVGRLFKGHNINYRKSALFCTPIMPELPKQVIDIKTVVVLTSGAGDWTALKNRSDEDIMFELFVDVAKAMPEIKIIYRPHPLWVHPAHQGRNSIKRLKDYVHDIGLPNVIISDGAEKESWEFMGDGSLSIKAASITGEIESADVIFGDHSQTMINAARKGKMFASIHVTKRRSFFEEYITMGFPCCTNAREVTDFLRGLMTSTDVIDRYNNAVRQYNASL